MSERDAVAWNENEIADLTAKVGALRASMARVIIGQDEVVESLIICLLVGMAMRWSRVCRGWARRCW
ncbi:hypothetical protein LP420_17455 [Massilia sp. B-10]|nr:hypothetical protein LP420_17455 [Massilia sp. B-10]